MSGKALLWTALALSVVVEALWSAVEAGLPWWHRLPVFHAAYGVVGCVGIVVVSKALGKFWLQRSEERDD